MKKINTFDTMRIWSLISFALLFLATQAQEDFRNKPWKAEDVKGKSPVTLRFSPDGILLDTVPQYLFNKDNNWIPGAPRDLRIVVVPDAAGKQTGRLKALELLMERLEAKVKKLSEPGPSVFHNASMGGADTTWTHKAYSAAVDRLRKGQAMTANDRLFFPDFEGYEVRLRTDGSGASSPKVMGLKRDPLRDVVNINQWVPNYSGPIHVSLVKRLGHVNSWMKELRTRHWQELTQLDSALAADSVAMHSLLSAALLPGARCDTLVKQWNVAARRANSTFIKSDVLIARYAIERLWILLVPRPRPPQTLPDTTGEQRMREYVAAYGKVLDCCGEGSERTLKGTQRILAAQDQVAEQLRLLNLCNKIARDSVSAYENARELFNGRSRTLNDVLLFTSTARKGHFMRHFDAASNYGPLSNAVRNEYYTFEKVHLLIHNLDGSIDPKLLALTATAVPMEDHAPAVAQELTSQIGLLSGLFTGTSVSAKTLGSSLHLGGLDTTALSTNCAAMGQEMRDWMKVFVNDRKQKLATLDSIKTELKSVSESEPGKSQRRTVEVNFDEQPKPKSTVTYTLWKLDPKDKSKKEELRRGTYDLWALQRWRLFGGVSYAVGIKQWNIQPLQRTTITVDNGLVAVTRSNDQARFLVGLQYHPFGGGAEIDDDRIVFHPRRVGVALGVGLPKPLDDLYAGLSYDIYPGFNIALMAQWYRNDALDLKNGVVTERRNVYQAVPAVAVTLDSSLFTTLLKFLAL